MFGLRQDPLQRHVRRRRRARATGRRVRTGGGGALATTVEVVPDRERMLGRQPVRDAVEWLTGERALAGNVVAASIVPTHARREGARRRRGERPGARARSVLAVGRQRRTDRGRSRAGPRRRRRSALSSADADRPRPAPYARVEHAVSGEAVAATLAAAWHEKGFTGKGVKVADHRRRLHGSRRAPGRRRSAGERRDAGPLRGGLATADDHGTAVAEIVHEMAPDAQLYLVCVEHGGRSRGCRRVREEPGRAT